MIESIIQFDKSLFYFINVTLSNPVTDFLMPIITNGRYWLPVYIALFIYLLFFNHIKNQEYINRNNNYNFFKNLIIFNKLGIAIAIILALSAILADQISANLIKDIVGRLRPCKELENINLLVNCGAGKSFPSAHATNNFAAAVTLSYFFRKYIYIFITIAALVALSRVFVGVHYPVDITAGAILGTLISFSLIIIFNKFIKNKIIK